MFSPVSGPAHPLRMTWHKEGLAMVEIGSVLLASGAVLVAIVSIFGLDWLAVAIPLLFASGGAYVLFTLIRLWSRRGRRGKAHDRMAA